LSNNVAIAHDNFVLYAAVDSKEIHIIDIQVATDAGMGSTEIAVTDFCVMPDQTGHIKRIETT
jgi:hypothetical protein